MKLQFLLRHEGATDHDNRQRIPGAIAPYPSRTRRRQPTAAAPRLIAGVAIVAFICDAVAQTAFQNLDFELGSLPASPAEVLFSQALPGWTGTFHTNSGADVNITTAWFNAEPISSGGICVWDASYSPYFLPLNVKTQVLHGRYCVSLQSGWNAPDGGMVSTSLSQVGSIPASARSITFRAYALGPRPRLTFDGNPIRLWWNDTTVSGDVIDLAGRTGALSFTVANDTSTPPLQSRVLLDYIRFSPLPAFPSPSILSPPGSQTAETGSSVRLAVKAEGERVLGFQWFFNATNALAGSIKNSSLLLANIQPNQAGAYTVIVSNIAGAVTSAPALLSVIPAVERRLVPAMNVNAQPGAVLNLEYAADLARPQWMPLASLALTNTSEFYFDLSAPLPPQRFFRAWAAQASNSPPELEACQVAALTLRGTVGSRVQVQAINQYGPVDAWATLATVTLTNTPQLYFDVSAVGQPPRLWRILSLP